MNSDIWAVTFGSDADFYVTTASGTASTPFTLANTQPEYHGVAYKVTVTPAADETGKNFVIVGTGVDGNSLTETLAGDSSAFTSTNYFVSVTSITPDANTAGAVTIGYALSAGVYLPLTRIKAVYYVASGSAGSIVVTKAGSSQTILNLATPASATATQDIMIPANGLRTADAPSDYSTVAVTNVTSVTLMCA